MTNPDKSYYHLFNLQKAMRNRKERGTGISRFLGRKGKSIQNMHCTGKVKLDGLKLYIDAIAAGFVAKGMSVRVVGYEAGLYSVEPLVEDIA